MQGSTPGRAWGSLSDGWVTEPGRLSGVVDLVQVERGGAAAAPCTAGRRSVPHEGLYFHEASLKRAERSESLLLEGRRRPLGSVVELLKTGGQVATLRVAEGHHSF